MTRSDLPEGYGSLVEALKLRIRDAQLKAALLVNPELFTLYWNVGCTIVERISSTGIPRIGGVLACKRVPDAAFYLAYPARPVSIPEEGPSPEVVA